MGNLLEKTSALKNILMLNYLNDHSNFKDYIYNQLKYSYNTVSFLIEICYSLRINVFLNAKKIKRKNIL